MHHSIGKTIVVNTPLGKRTVEIVGRAPVHFTRQKPGTMPVDKFGNVFKKSATGNTWVCAGEYREFADYSETH